MIPITRGISSFPSGSAGSLVFAVRSYEITFPCEEELVCYHMWSFNKKMTRDYVAVATTGLIRASSNVSDCSQPIKDQTDSNVQICTNGTQVPFAEMGEDTRQIPDDTISMSYTRSPFCDPPQTSQRSA